MNSIQWDRVLSTKHVMKVSVFPGFNASRVVFFFGVAWLRRAYHGPH